MVMLYKEKHKYNTCANYIFSKIAIKEPLSMACL